MKDELSDLLWADPLSDEVVEEKLHCLDLAAVDSVSPTTSPMKKLSRAAKRWRKVLTKKKGATTPPKETNTLKLIHS